MWQTNLARCSCFRWTTRCLHGSRGTQFSRMIASSVYLIALRVCSAPRAPGFASKPRRALFQLRGSTVSTVVRDAARRGVASQSACDLCLCLHYLSACSIPPAIARGFCRDLRPADRCSPTRCLRGCVPADLVVGEGQTGIVEQVPSGTNPLFVVRLEGARENEIKHFPRSQLRPMTHETMDRYRHDLGYGRGQVT